MLPGKAFALCLIVRSWFKPGSDYLKVFSQSLVFSVDLVLLYFLSGLGPEVRRSLFPSIASATSYRGKSLSSCTDLKSCVYFVAFVRLTRG